MTCKGEESAAQISKDFGLSVTLKRWIAIVERKENRAARRQGHQPKMIYPLAKDLATDGVPVAVTCRVLEFSKQSYYRRRPAR